MQTLEQIAAALQGYDPQALAVAQVQAFLQALVTPLPDTANEEIPLLEAAERVLSHNVISPIDVPAHDNSAMDGYAFRGQDLTPTQDTVLRIVGTAFAGKAWQGTVQTGECLRIMTGAILPAGLDTVVPQELCRLNEADATVTLPGNTVKPGDNRRLRGEDLRQGAAALRQGQRLTPAALGLLASLGLPRVKVMRRLRVAYFSTGDEVLSLGEAAREGAIYDSNRYTVFGMLRRLGCEVIDLGVVPDDPSRLEQAFSAAAQQADAVITSGGVSVGEADFTKAMMKKLGDVAFWKIAMRPGRPMAVGRIGLLRGG